ncbi:MAG: flagellar basal-body rod protein FlgG [Candidatus Krumholzibacteria bacterium]|nr:flagellar basal-body rod protein FlgG [Candidatus Krumholzibacteria bacterium]
MMRAMGTAASGMKAMQLQIDTISNNLANVNTTGFKKSTMQFQDLLYESVVPGGQLRADGLVGPSRVEVGHGVKMVSTSKDFRLGTVVSTGNPLDLMIEGDGFFQLRLPDGDLGYTRDGSFKLDGERNIVTSLGYRLEPALQVPADAVEIGIARDGTVSVQLAGQSANVQEIGRIELVRFPNAAGLIAKGSNVFLESPASGVPMTANPGEDGVGELASGFLEMSNVETVDELVRMITAQRAYELNSKTIGVADQMLQTVANIKR